MGDERYVDSQWPEKGLFEVCERYREQALRLILDAELCDKPQVCDEIIVLMREHIDKLGELLELPVDGSVIKALDFAHPYNKAFKGGYLRKITKQTDRFRKLAISILRTTNAVEKRRSTVEEKISKAPLMIGGVLKCIVEMRERVQIVNFREVTKADIEKYPFLAEFSQTMLPCDLKLIVQNHLKLAGFKKLRDLEPALGIDVNLYNLFLRRTIPKKGKQRTAYIKVWNWLVESMLRNAN